MKKQNHLSEFRFDIHITGASNGVLVEYPEVCADGVIIHSSVYTSKDDILKLVSASLDEFYKK